MSKPKASKQHFQPSDLLGASRLAIDATIGMTNLVETMHHNISRVPGIFGTPTDDPTRGITGFVYRSIRGVTRAVGGGLDIALGQVVEMVKQESPSNAREAVLSALNGVLGDHLVGSVNPMAITMQLRRDGEALTLTKKELSRAIPNPSGRILVLVHGLCMSDLQWQRNGHDHGAALAADPAFGNPFTTVYLHYNSGQHISVSGRAFAEQLQALLKAWPVPVQDLTVLAHSMGGLVTRSACDFGAQAGHRWLPKLKKIIFLGTPHFGAPLERGGNWVNVILDSSPYTAAFARLAKIRSAGITDLRHADVRDEDWEDQDRFALSSSKTHDLPLPKGVACYAIAASIGKKSATAAGRLVGDGLVPVYSALGQHKDPARALDVPKSRQWTGHDMNHMDLLDRKIVYRRIRKWLLE
jgi:pimeloyl-ACP methyl ester carboxylesterase